MRKTLPVIFSLGAICVITIAFLIYKDDGKCNSNDKVRCLTQMAEQGNKTAQVELGIIYGEGSGVAPNYDKAAYWYKKSAAQDSVDALFNLGLFYEKGWGVIKNLQLAREYYKKAVTKGSVDAQVNLGFLYMKGLGGDVNYTQAIKLFVLASEKKNPIALYNLGYIYNYGLGVPKNENEAAIWYRKAVDLGSMSAKNSLALFYSRGAGNLPVDRKKAFELLISSACQGYVIAQNNLGILYTDGTEELKKDPQQAYAWFSVAFYNGFEKADISRKKIENEMDSAQIEKAKVLASEYIRKYYFPPNGMDTNRSNTQCFQSQ
ncbi:TPA: tetratricopeptide repeat protein [Salmonella enterica subsp. houtenae serovar [1],40:z4,z23:-]